MQIWGKIVGGTAGLAIGGPIAALLGVMAGHAVDQYVLDARPSSRSRRPATGATATPTGPRNTTPSTISMRA